MASSLYAPPPMACAEPGTSEQRVTAAAGETVMFGCCDGSCVALDAEDARLYREGLLLGSTVAAVVCLVVLVIILWFVPA
jgi:hypothetical protein